MSAAFRPDFLAGQVDRCAASTVAVVECVTDPVTTFDVLTELHYQADTLALDPLGDGAVIVALIAEVANRYLGLLIEQAEYESREGES